jgi:predicted phage terminase large subunit-like protein
MVTKAQKLKFISTILDNPYIPHDPTLKQAEFLFHDDLEVGYGGAAGGGKSDALLMAALQYVTEPDYSAILFRRTYTDLALPKALMDRAHTWLDPTDAVWKSQDKTWRFPSGATLTFGYIATNIDVTRYQSAEFQFVGFDEATQFTSQQYQYLFSRLRRLEGSKIPIRMRSATNPGGVGHEWYKRRFISEPEDGIVFIPSKLDDNPHLDTKEYEEQALSRLDPITRRQLRDGDWDAILKGEYFKREWFNFINRSQIPKMSRTVRFWDIAATEKKRDKDDPDYCVGLLLGIRDKPRIKVQGKYQDQESEYYILDVTRFRKNPGETEDTILKTAQMDGLKTYIGIEQEPGGSSKILIAGYQKRLKGYKVFPVLSGTDKTGRAKNVSADVSHGRVYIVIAGWNSDFIYEVEKFPTDGIHDDQVDAFSGAHYLVQELPKIGKPIEFHSSGGGKKPFSLGQNIPDLYG